MSYPSERVDVRELTRQNKTDLGNALGTFIAPRAQYIVWCDGRWKWGGDIYSTYPPPPGIISLGQLLAELKQEASS